MSGRLFLSGGGDEQQTFELDELFLKDVKTILYIPVAWPNEDFDSCLKWFTTAMEQHKKVKIEMLTDLNKSPDLADYDAVYIGGGNTFKLLKKIRESSFDKKLSEYYHSGGTVYGGSAGAIIWGNDINIASICMDADVNLVGLKDTRGFDVLNGIDVQCHYEQDQAQEHQQYIEKSGRNVIAIPEESALLVSDAGAMVIGTMPVSFITRTVVKEYSADEMIKLPLP